MAGKTIIVNSATKATLVALFPAATVPVIAEGLSTDQIEYLANIISDELQIQTTFSDVKDLFTRIMAQA